jgi:1-acyl-sn-glycerol-3-phosphate acyltransferase
VVKQELSRVPFFGWGAGVGVVWVKREDRAAATASLATSLDDLPADWSMFIFPEGTRSKDGRLGPFKKGVVHMALQSRRPVVPIGTYGSGGIVPPGGWLIRSGPIELTVGAPIDTSGWSLEHLDEHLAQLRAAIVELQAQSRARYEAKYGPLAVGGARTLALELRGSRAAAVGAPA